MEITFKGTPKEVTELLQAIGGSKEQTLEIDSNLVAQAMYDSVRAKREKCQGRL